LQPTADDELRQLMRRYQAGEVEAFEEIYARTLTMVRGYLAALSVDRSLTFDLVQDVYLQMHRSRQTYDPTRPVKPWVAGITRHVWLMARRSHARRRSPEVAGLEEAIDLSVAPDFEGFGARTALARALAAVPSDQREALVLHHLYGLSFGEIARVAGVSEGAARIRASRGMHVLRRQLGGLGAHHG
jgi:RNA polymerase sigma-70 factor (ECF subfamily)